MLLLKPLKALWLLLNLTVLVIGVSYLFAFATMGTNVQYSSNGLPVMENGECWETSYGYGCQPDLTVAGFELWNPMQQYEWQPLIEFRKGYTFNDPADGEIRRFNSSGNFSEALS